MTNGKIWRCVLRTIGWVIGIILLLLVVAVVLLNSEWAQNRLMTATTQLLSKQLQTRVSVDRVSIAFLTQDVRLHGVCIEDLQKRPMLNAGLLVTDVDLRALMHNKVIIDNARFEDVAVHIYKPRPDSAANYQFVIDAFSDTTKSSSTPMQLDIHRVKAKHIALTYNTDSLSLGRLDCHLGGKQPKVMVEDITASWMRLNRKGQPVDRHVDLKRATYSPDNDKMALTIEKLNYKSDNHLPRKNTGKPNKGFFDAGHLDVTADLTFVINSISTDSVNAVLKQCVATDPVTGMDIRDLHCNIVADKRAIHLTDVIVRQVDTQLKFARGDIYLPDSAAGKPLTYSTSVITGNVHLKDISRAFGPVLKGFTLPLTLSTTMSGNDDGMKFNNVVVTMPGKSFKVHAAGTVSGLRAHDKRMVKVHFDVNPMTVRASDVESIIRQFPVKRFMMSQLKSLNTISYKGGFDVIYKHEKFRGHLQTAIGGLDFNFDIDHLSKYLSGNLSAQAIEVGKAINMPDIGRVAATANFKIDISKERTAAIRRANGGGKLPIGEASAHVSEASYKFLSTHNLDVTITTNGTIANGSLVAPGKYVDLSCTFTFDDTDNMHKMKIKPGMKLHGSHKKQ